MPYLVVLSDAIMLSLFFFKINLLPPQIPLFFSKSWGEDQLGEFWMIIFLPIFMNLFIIMNSFIVNRYFSGNPFVKKVIEYLNIAITVTFTLIFLKIIFLVA